jgi:hypothetical protein
MENTWFFFLFLTGEFSSEHNEILYRNRGKGDPKPLSCCEPMNVKDAQVVL